MKKLNKLIFLPLSLLSTIAIIHNAYLAKETAALHTGYQFLDWLLAVTFSIGIESGLWVLIIHRKKQAVQAYALILFALNVLYYGRDGKLNQIINMMHPEAWTYIEGILACLIFSALLSGFAWFLSEIAIEQLFKEDKVCSTNLVGQVNPISLVTAKQWPATPIIQADPQPVIVPVTDKIPVEPTVTVPEEPVTAVTIHLVDTDTKMCLNCSNSFEPKRKDAVYCSPTCKQQNYRKNLKKEVA